MPRSPFRRWLLATLALFVVLAVAAWLWLPAPAPEVVFTTTKGEKLPLQALKGRVVLVNFWAPSCAPCVREMPMLAETYARLHARGLEVVAVAVSYDPPNIVLDYAQTRHLPFPIALDIEDVVAHAFGGLRAVPSTVVIGRDGRIVRRVDGALDPVKLQKLLEQQLGNDVSM
ncbi:MAG: TlpA family protein disulfide reductase [Burkholderiaceae bacterium]|nr:TlpA family protein disulfide reductase [Burkholderiaceae bacterium]